MAILMTGWRNLKVQMIFSGEVKMEIPLNALVECTDGVFGRSEYVLINQVDDGVTHLVVKDDSSPNTEYIVLVEFVTETITDTIRLKCGMAELEKTEPFIKTKFFHEQLQIRYSSYGGINYGMGSFYMPYPTPDITVCEKEKIRQIPPGELPVRRGTHVEATDGYEGKVDKFVVHLETGRITHLVMQEGHLWGQKDVTIPVSQIDHYRDNTVYLK